MEDLRAELETARMEIKLLKAIINDSIKGKKKKMIKTSEIPNAIQDAKIKVISIIRESDDKKVTEGVIKNRVRSVPNDLCQIAIDELRQEGYLVAEEYYTMKNRLVTAYSLAGGI